MVSGMAKEDNLHPCVLLVDDEEYVLDSWKALLEANGLANVLTCADSREVLETIGRGQVEVVVLDLIMPHLPGTELLSEIRKAYPDIPVIVVTGRDEVSLAVECMKLGAFDYMVKTVEESRFINGIRKAFEFRELHREHDLLKNQFFDRRLKRPEAFAAVLTRSQAMLSVFLYLEAIAASSQPVLITGETGTGKDLLALVVHNLSGREGAFLAANVAGFDDSLFSDTLFGHKKGAFTGAVQDRKGLVEQAAEGTLFLDEIGELSVASQVKLLRLLEAREYFPIGSDSVKRSSARVVLATNRDLPALVERRRLPQGPLLPSVHAPAGDSPPAGAQGGHPAPGRPLPGPGGGGAGQEAAHPAAPALYAAGHLRFPRQYPGAEVHGL